MIVVLALAVAAIIAVLWAVFGGSPSISPSRPATGKQKAFARELGIHYHPRITLSEMSHLIGQALKQRESDAIERANLAAEQREIIRDQKAAERETEHEAKALDRSHAHDLELLERKLADIRSGKPLGKATLAQKEIANRFHIIHAVDATKKELGDAMEEKLNEMRGEFEKQE